MKRKGNSSVNTIIIVIGLMLLSRVIGLIRDTYIGSSFGTDASTDTYFMSLLLTTGLFLGVGSALATNLIPLVVKSKETDENPVTEIVITTLVIALVTSLVYFFISPFIVPLFAKGYSGDKLVVTIEMTKMIIPSIFFVIMTYLSIGLLHGNQKFIMPAMVSIPFNLIFFIYIYFFGKQFGVYGLSVVTSIGWATQAIFVGIPALKGKYLKKVMNFRHKKRAIGRFYLNLLPIIVVTLTHQINIMIDNQQASFFGDGKVSAIYYGNILFKAIVTTTVYAITAVMFPKFSRKFITENEEGLYQSVINVIRSVGLLLIPMSLGLIVFGDSVISMIFQRGMFDSASSQVTILTFSGYTSFMIAFGVIEVLNKAYYAMNNRRIPLLMTGVITILNILFSNILVGTIGFVGIPIGTSLAYYVGAFISIMIFIYKDPTKGLGRLSVSMFKVIIATGVMTAVVLTYRNSIGLSVVNDVTSLMKLAGGIIIGVLSYAVTLYVIREDLIKYNVDKLVERYIKHL